MKRSSLPPGTALRRTGILRRTPLARGLPLRRGVWRRCSAPRPAVPVDVRKAAIVRSGGECEIQIWLPKRVCLGAGSQVHHRVVRGMGGCRSVAARERSDRLSGVLFACGPCHAHVHAYPDGSYQSGALVSRGKDTSAIACWVKRRLVYLDDLGGVHDYEAGVA